MIDYTPLEFTHTCPDCADLEPYEEPSEVCRKAKRAAKAAYWGNEARINRMALEAVQAFIKTLDPLFDQHDVQALERIVYLSHRQIGAVIEYARDAQV